MKNLAKVAISCLGVLSFALTAVGQQDVVTTVVGGGPNGIPGVNANLNQPYTVAVDSQGNTYVAAYGQHRVFKINTAGVITVVAGTGIAGYSGDGGKAVNAQLYYPWGVAVDSANPANVYIGDTSNCLVRKVNGSTGSIVTIAGLVTVPTTGAPYTTCGFAGDGGAANKAELNQPGGITVNPGNNDVYIAEYANGRVRKVAGGTSSGTITTVAGGGGSTTVAGNCGGSAPYGDGSTATDAYLCYPQYVSLDTTVSPANVFVSEYYRCAIREVVGSNKNIYRVAGSYTLGCGFTDNVTATSAQLNDPWQSHIAVSGGTTTVTFADYSNDRIRQFPLTYSGGVPSPGTITTIAGKGQGGFCGDAGPALSACMSPVGLAFDSSGNMFIGDYGSDRVREITKSNGYINTTGGWGANGGTNVTYSNPVGITNDPGTGVALYRPYGVLADPTSTKVYVSDTSGYSDYVWGSFTTEVSDYAGNGVGGFAGDGTLADGAGTEVNFPSGFARDSSGNIYIADQNNCVIREVEHSTGDITTIAGGYAGHQNGCGFSGNGGTAVNAQLYYPLSVAVDGANNIYVSEYGYCDVRKINASTGIISTFAGSETCGYSGDGGSANSAKMYYPYDISFDGSGNLFIADTNNNRIRRVDAATHIITTVAGDGGGGYSGDGPAIGVELNQPESVYADPNGNLFIADYYNSIVRWVSPTGQLITFAGSPPGSPQGNYGFAGDGGLATSALFAYAARVTQDNSGNFYISDTNNSRVRKVTAFAGYGLSASNLTFETQPVGTTSDFEAVKVSAIGPVTISAIAVTSGFSEVDDCIGATLAARSTCEIDVYFDPTTVGTTRGTLTISSNAFFPASGNTVSLIGTGAGLGISGSLSFGTQLINTSVTRTLTLKNSGSSSVSLSSITLPYTISFTVLSTGTCPLGTGSLAAGASCTIQVKFDPTSIGSKKGTLIIKSSEPASPLLVLATGTGTNVKLSSTSLAFGSVTDGTTKTLDLTVTNVATSGTLTVSTAISGTGFSITTGDTCTSPVAAGASCTVPVTFSPTAAQSYAGTLTLTTNGDSNPVVALSGTGH